MHVTSAFDRVLTLFAGFVVAVVVAANGHAQLAAGHLPEPTDSRTLTRLLKRFVSPTVQQWLEIEAVHDAYLARFEALHDGDIAQFNEFVHTSMTSVPDAATAREYLRRRSHVAAKIAEQDDRLLNEIALVLEEEEQQLVGLARVRSARERSRHGLGLTAPGASQVQDLWSVLSEHERKLGKERLKLLDAELHAYEDRLGPALKAWHEAQDSMFLVLIKELQLRGLGDLSAGDVAPEMMKQTIDVLQEAIRTGQEECREAAARVRKLNGRTIKSIEMLLGEDLGRRIRMAYVEQDSAGRITRDPARLERTYLRILESEALEEAAREELRGLRNNYRAADDRLVARMAEQCRRLDELVGPFGAIEVEHDDPIGVQIAETRDSLENDLRARNELAERAHEQLRLVVEGLGSAELLSFFDSGGFDDGEASSDEEPMNALAGRDPNRGGPTGFIPKRISKRAMERLGRRLQLESWQEAVLLTIYDDYVDAWRLEVAPIAAESARAQSTIYRVEPETLRRVADPGKLLLAYERAAVAAGKAEAIDQAFFEALHPTLDKSQQGDLLRARHARDLDRFLLGTDPIFNPAEIAFSPGNVVNTIDGLDLTEAEDALVDEFLRVRMSPLLSSARSARDVRFETERKLHELNMRMSVGMADGTKTSTDHGIAYRQLSEDMAQAHGPSVQQCERTHQSFTEDLGKLLGEDHARQFARSWKEASNPFVYRDPNSAVLPIEQALGLGDITSEQIGAIGEILVDYEEEWAELSSEMADVRSEMHGFGALTPPEEYADWDVLNERFRVLSFRRDEASLRALRRLARYLEPDQQERIRALRRLDE